MSCLWFIKNIKCQYVMDLNPKMRCYCRKWWKLILTLYILGSCITSFIFILQTTYSSEVVPSEQIPWRFRVLNGTDLTTTQAPAKNEGIVEIWGKAAIGLYLWQHIFEGSLQFHSPGWNSGQVLINKTLFRFHTGPGVTLESVSQDVSHVLLVLNGREQSKIDFARDWLDYARYSPGMRSIGVVLLGNEECSNLWIFKYLRTFHGLVKYLFLTYDSLEVDDNIIYQWPLGVATYRNFPVVSEQVVDLTSHRKYLCNFVGTVYPNSSREILMDVLRSSHLTQRCYIQERLEWQPQETQESLDKYIYALQNSDLTLNPVGMNAECYRIYEAMSYGSVPVIEDRSTSFSCGGWSKFKGSSATSGVFRLLKKYQAPVIFINDWRKLPELLQIESKMSRDKVIARRKEIVEWYRKFRRQMRDRLVNVVQRNMVS